MTAIRQVINYKRRQFLNMILVEFVISDFISLMQIVHPILDQSIFLDNTHKMRLKEEFGIYIHNNPCACINYHIPIIYID